MPPPPTADTVLDLEVRRRIVEFVTANPGLHMRELAARLDLAVSTLEYHTYQLVKHEHLVTRESAGFKAFYPGAGMDRRDKDILYLVRHEAPRKVCSHLLLNPGATPKELRDILNVSAPTLSFHLNKLRSAGIVREEPAGRTKHLFVEDPERVANLLVTYRKSFLDDAADRFASAWLALAPPKLPRPAKADDVQAPDLAALRDDAPGTDARDAASDAAPSATADATTDEEAAATPDAGQDAPAEGERER